MTYDPAFLAQRIRLFFVPSYLSVLAITGTIWFAIAVRLGLVTLFEDGSFIAGAVHGCLPWAICAL